LSTQRNTERAVAQRERILNAAQSCFIKHGFHSAGMALVAEAAEMSPGLIYRYFPSKSAIILAIIERQLEEARADIRKLYGAQDFAAGIYDCFRQWGSADPLVMNATLFLEMSAEGARDPAIANALRASDLALRKELSTWMSADPGQGGKGLPTELATVRAISLVCFVEGLAVRALREPDLSPEALKAAIDHFLKGLFET
jgi:AcrR family transcriptional regulator